MDDSIALAPSITSGSRRMHLKSGPLHPSSGPAICGMPSLSVSGPAAAEVPNRHRLGSDVVHHPVAADTQPPSVKRPVGERPGRAGLISEPGDRVEHLADSIGVVAEEPGGLADRLGLPDDLAVHPASPSRRSASSCVTYEVCPAASLTRQSASATSSSASSSSCGLAACSRVRRRRKSETGTTTAASPPRWITSYGTVSGPLAGIRSGRSSCCLLYV